MHVHDSQRDIYTSSAPYSKALIGSSAAYPTARLLRMNLTISSLSVLWLLFFVHKTTAAKFDPLQHSGPASPYFDAPSEDGISEDTPDGCIVDQAAYIIRHGS